MTQTSFPLTARDTGGWSTGRMLALDYETTGKDPATCRPVSVSCILVEPNGQPVQDGTNYQTLVDAGVDIPVEAALVHGITRELCQQGGVPAETAARAVAELVDLAVMEEWPLVIFNAPFDWRLYLEELRRAGLRPGPAPYIVDPLTIERHLDPGRGSKKLADVATKYGVQLDNAHDATADCLAAVGVARAQAARNPRLASMTLEALQTAQAGYYATHRIKTNQWLRRSNRPVITNGWPA